MIDIILRLNLKQINQGVDLSNIVTESQADQPHAVVNAVLNLEKLLVSYFSLTHYLQCINFNNKTLLYI